MVPVIQRTLRLGVEACFGLRVEAPFAEKCLGQLGFRLGVGGADHECHQTSGGKCGVGQLVMTRHTPCVVTSPRPSLGDSAGRGALARELQRANRGLFVLAVSFVVSGLP
jgi:hypothetical protein